MNKQFCVFGDPIAHSLSPQMHNFAFEILQNKIGFKGSYGRYLLKDGDKLAKSFYDLRLDGANITLPFKESAFEQSDRVEGIAQKIGAVNTWVLKNRKICGYNTDAEGFYQTIKDFDFKNALILGAGGSAKAIAFILQEKKIVPTILNRSSERIRLLQKDFDCFTPQNFKAQQFDIIINTTSASLKDVLPFDKELLQDLLCNAKYAYDLMYAKPTPFLQLAKNFTPIKDGKDMLIAQGALAFELFCAKKIPQVFSLMQKAL